MNTSEEQALVAALKAYRAANESRQASAAIEQAVLSAFRARANKHAKSKWRGFVAAAALLMAVGLTLRNARSPRPQIAPPAPVQVASRELIPSAGKPVNQRIVKPQMVRAKSKRSRPVVVNDFIALPFAPPLRQGDSAQVYRVEVPQASLAVFGLAFRGDRAGERINADVVLGEDGIVRAIRFVQ